MSMARRKKAAQTNAAVSKGTTTIKRGPRVSPKADGGVIVANTEYIQDVTDNSIIGKLDINPGLSMCFPWLCKMAHSFESYRFKRLVFHYTPTCSTSTAGIVVMAVDYDASDGPPADKIALSSFSGSERVNVWNRASLSVESKPQPYWYYTSPDVSTPNPTGTDIKLYDTGLFLWGVFNTVGTGGNTLGELTVEYEVEFAKPQTATALGPSAFFVPNVPSGNMATNLFTNGVTTTNADIVFTADTITFKTPGQYLVDFFLNAQTTSTVDIRAMFNLTYTYGGVNTTLSWSGWLGTSGVGSSATIFGFVTLVAAAGAVLTFVPQTVATGATLCYVVNARISNYQKSLG